MMKWRIEEEYFDCGCCGYFWFVSDEEGLLDEPVFPFEYDTYERVKRDAQKFREGLNAISD